MSIIKQIFDWDAMITFSKYFLNYPSLRLTRAKNNKGIDVVDTCIRSPLIERTFARPSSFTIAFINISIELFDIS